MRLGREKSTGVVEEVHQDRQLARPVASGERVDREVPVGAPTSGSPTEELSPSR